MSATNFSMLAGGAPLRSGSPTKAADGAIPPPVTLDGRYIVVRSEASLERLGTGRLDLYLLHWRGSVPLGETVETMERLVAAGKIVRWGVSNLDTNDMEELIAAGAERCQTDQNLFNLTRRGSTLR